MGLGMARPPDSGFLNPIIPYSGHACSIQNVKVAFLEKGHEGTKIRRHEGKR